MKPQKAKVQFFFKKVRNQLAVLATIFVETDDGKTHSKKFVINHPDIAKAKRIAKGQANIFLLNKTRHLNVVEI